MTRKRTPLPRRDPVPALRARLKEAEATLEAIRTGQVDALVVSGPQGDRTLAIEGATDPYHVLLNAMSDGAALMGADGTILFASQRLAQIAGVPVAQLRGSRFSELIAAVGRPALETIVQGVGGPRAAGEFTIPRRRGSPIPVWISLSTLSLGVGPSGAEAPAVLMAILSDLTERKRAEAIHLVLAKRLLSVEVEERRRIARELHDETGQSLTALLVGLRVIEERTRVPEVRDAARRLRKIAAETVDNVGRLARGLHPSVLDDLGLLAATRRYVGDYTKSFDLTVDFRSVGIGAASLPSLVQTTVYRIMQEALTNVARHAQARSVRMELKLEGGILGLLVQDDGRGFDSAGPLRGAAGLGLHAMRERVVLLGGKLEVESRPGTGTTLRARIPVGSEAGVGR